MVGAAAFVACREAASTIAPHMVPTARAIWSALEIRKPMLLRNVEPLDESQLRWRPGPARNSIAWQIWHIAEVEDNWIRATVMREPLRFPFGRPLLETPEEAWPGGRELLAYLDEVRLVSRERLASSAERDFEVTAEDPDFGTMSVLDVWMGVATSFSWHAGQVALTAKLMPDSPVVSKPFEGWAGHEATD